MFSRCFSSNGGSWLSNALYRGPRHIWRRWVHCCTQCVSRPSSRRDTQRIVSANKFDHNNPNFLKNMVDYIATALNNNDRLFVGTFMAIYPKYATTWEVLDMVMKRYSSFQPYCKKDQEDRRAIAYFLEFWMKNLPQDFCESPDLAMLNQLKTYVSLNMASSNLAACVQLLLSLLENTERFGSSSTGSSGLQAQDNISGARTSELKSLPKRAVTKRRTGGTCEPGATNDSGSQRVNLEPCASSAAEPEPVQMEALEPAAVTINPGIPAIPKPVPLPTALDLEQPLPTLVNTQPPPAKAANTTVP